MDVVATLAVGSITYAAFVLSVSIRVSSDSETESFAVVMSMVADEAPMGITTLPASAVKSLPLEAEPVTV